MLSRKQLLSGASVKTGVVKIHGGEIGIREFNGAERVDFLTTATDETVAVDMTYQAKIVCNCAIDKDGDRIFKDGDVDSVFSELGGEALQDIVLAVLALSGLTTDAAEELEKNSEGGLSVVDGSDSPKRLAAQ